MIRCTFTCARSLTGGHEPGDTVTVEFSAAHPLTPGREVKRDQQVAINGARETLHHYGLRIWSVTTGPLFSSALDAVVEFLDSCEGGELFGFEPWRHESGPSLDLDFTVPRLRVAEAIDCYLTNEGYSFSLLAAEDTGGADDVYQLSFTVIEAP